MLNLPEKEPVMDAYLTNNLEQSDELAYDVADLFKLFADSTRIRILVLLFDRELCVGDIAANLEMSQTAISHQLRILKQNHLIKYRREGKNMIYALADDHVKTIINCAIEHIEEQYERKRIAYPRDGLRLRSQPPSPRRRLRLRSRPRP